VTGGTEAVGSGGPDAAVPSALPLGRGSVAWKVNSEPAAIAGGGRAVLLQVAHPGVGAGVQEHSSYATDPWGRFFRTMDIMMKLSFGTPEVSARQARVLDRMHARVRGVREDGRGYDARDPELQLWVWATLVDTAELMYRLVRGGLRPAERGRFYEESKLVAHGCGVPVGACPATWDDFQDYVRTMVADDLVVTDAARSVARATVVPPLPTPVGRLAAGPHRLLTVGLLPPSVRDQYGFDWDRRREARLRATLAAARAGSAVLPTPVRRLGATRTVEQPRAMRWPWLQRRGAELTARRLGAVPRTGVPG
jgi:uncharacterized protein (DUF2236 family)